MDVELTLSGTVAPAGAGAWPDPTALDPSQRAQLSEVLRLFDPAWSGPSDAVPDGVRALSECPIECWDAHIEGALAYRLWLAVDGGWFFVGDTTERVEALYVSAYALYDERDAGDDLAQALERARASAAASHPQSVLAAMSFEPEV